MLYVTLPAEHNCWAPRLADSSDEAGSGDTESFVESNFHWVSAHGSTHTDSTTYIHPTWLHLTWLRGVAMPFLVPLLC